MSFHCKAQLISDLVAANVDDRSLAIILTVSPLPDKITEVVSYVIKKSTVQFVILKMR